jgi:hypothetical protein
MQNLPTTIVSVSNNGIVGLGYVWNQIEDTWVEAEYTWDNVVQQAPPLGTRITNQQIL